MGAEGVLRPRRRLPLRADRDPADLLVQRLGLPDVPAQRVHAPLVPRVPHEPRSPGRAADERDRSPPCRASGPCCSASSRRSRSCGTASAGAGPSPRSSSARSSSRTSSSGSRCSCSSTRSASTRSILTVVIGHIVITLPYTILVLMPRLQQIDVFARGGRLRPRREPAAHVPLDHAAADPARGRLGVPDRVHDVVRRVRGRLVRRRDASDVPDLPLLGAALPEPTAAGDRRRGRRDRRLADRRHRRRGRPARRRAAARCGRARTGSASSASTDVCSGSHDSVTAAPTSSGASSSSARRCETMRPAPSRHGTACTCRGRRSPTTCPSSRDPSSGASAPALATLDALGTNGDAKRIARRVSRRSTGTTTRSRSASTRRPRIRRRPRRPSARARSASR